MAIVKQFYVDDDNDHEQYSFINSSKYC